MALSARPLPSGGQSELNPERELVEQEDELSQGPHLPRILLNLQGGNASASIYPVYSIDEIPPSLREYICSEINSEIARGLTLAQQEALTMSEFDTTWFRDAAVVGVMLLGDDPDMPEDGIWQRSFFGAFFIRAKYPGRSAHVCTGELIVNSRLRNKGLGRSLLSCMVNWATNLQFTLFVFDLVYETNAEMRYLCETSQFQRTGRLRGAGYINAKPGRVDAFIYSKVLSEQPPSQSSAGSQHRFDILKEYLKTGNYPEGSSRADKSRIRASASTYSFKDGKLMRGEREVISAYAEQVRVAQIAHAEDHSGINRTCAKLTPHYHWHGIKQTVNEVVRACTVCGIQAEKHTAAQGSPPQRAKRRRTTEDESITTAAPEEDKLQSEELDNTTNELNGILSSEIDDELNSMEMPEYFGSRN